MPGIGLLLETERCLDGVHLVNGFFRPRSERREPVRVVSADLNNLVVLDFVNARDDLAPFLSRYITGSIFTPIASETDGVESQPFAHIKTVEFWQENSRRNLIGAGGPNPIDALVSLSHPAIDLSASFHLQDGRPQMLARCERLLDFTQMEIAMVALEGAKLVACENCKNLFLTGPATSRRIHATHCSDRCRVAAMRARKKES